MAIAPMTMLFDSPGLSAVHGMSYVCTASVGLVACWRLAWSTAEVMPMKFGSLFWGSAGAGALTASEFTRWFNSWEAPVLLVGPLGGCSFHIAPSSGFRLLRRRPDQLLNRTRKALAPLPRGALGHPAPRSQGAKPLQANRRQRLAA